MVYYVNPKTDELHHHGVKGIEVVSIFFSNIFKKKNKNKRR